MSTKNTGRRGLFGLLAAAPVAAVTTGAKALSDDRIVGANELAISFCEVLGIETDQVSRVSIDCKANDFAKVSVERVVVEREARQLNRVLSDYVLVERS